MTTFQKVKLGSIANENRDAYLPSVTENIPYIGLEHIEQQTLRISGVGKSSDAMSQKKKFIAGDVLYGSLRPYFRKVYKPKFDGVCSTDITVIKPKNNCTNSYLFYLIASPGFISKASGAGTGTKMPRAGWKVVKDFIFDVPDLPTQTIIASVLSAYDDLIENNEKRIKALEEMAQLLYTEWFVKFKFPSHEKVKMVDSGTEYGMIPEGWEVKKLKEVANIISGYAFKSSDFQETGIPVIKIKNITSNNTVDVENTDFVSPEILTEKLSKYVLKDGDIIIAMTGATAGKIGRISTCQQMLLNQRVARINPKIGYYAFIWGSVETKEAQRMFYTLAGGAAQPNMSASQIEEVKTLIPTNNLLLWYEDLTLPILKQINQFQKSNWALRRTRDLLIPQLVTGKRILTTYP